MQAQENSQKMKRQRKFLMLGPLLIFPFIVMFFWAIGGGRGNAKGKQISNKDHGFNMDLPGAHLKDEKGLNKMKFYEEADKDSERLEEKLKSDPYFMQKIAGLTHPPKTDSANLKWKEQNANLNVEQSPDSNEEKVYRKLEQLKKIMTSPQGPAGNNASGGHGEQDNYSSTNPTMHEEVNRLEKMMQAMKTQGDPDDPETKRLNGMLDKIIKIQHPNEAVDNDATNKNMSGDEKFYLEKKRSNSSIGDFSGGVNLKDADADLEGKAFYSLDDKDTPDSSVSNLISAVVPVGQTVVAGSTLLLRLTEDAVIGIVTIAKDNLISGKVQWQNDRLIVTISSIRFKNAEYPVSLKVFDIDGIEGLNIPGSINRDVTKESLSQGISTLGITSADPSIGAQAATAGITAAKTLIGRKTKLIRAYVRAGYQVFLQNEKRVTR